MGKCKKAQTDAANSPPPPLQPPSAPPPRAKRKSAVAANSLFKELAGGSAPSKIETRKHKLKNSPEKSKNHTEAGVAIPPLSQKLRGAKPGTSKIQIPSSSNEKEIKQEDQEVVYSELKNDAVNNLTSLLRNVNAGKSQDSGESVQTMELFGTSAICLSQSLVQTLDNFGDGAWSRVSSLASQSGLRLSRDDKQRGAAIVGDWATIVKFRKDLEKMLEELNALAVTIQKTTSSSGEEWEASEPGQATTQEGFSVIDKFPPSLPSADALQETPLKEDPKKHNHNKSRIKIENESESPDVPSPSTEINFEERVTTIKCEVADHPEQPAGKRGRKQTGSLNCDICTFKGINKSSIRRHKARVHGNKRYECPICQKRFTMQSDAKNHFKNHPKNNQMVDAVILEEKEESEHQETIDENIKEEDDDDNAPNSGESSSLSCSLCEYKGTSRSSLSKHNLRQHGAKRFGCKLCEETFALFSDLSLHSCRIHRVGVNKPRALVKPKGGNLPEIQVYTKKEIAALPKDARPSPYLHVFRCEMCNYLGTASGLKSHERRVHTGAVYFCEYCSYTCNQETDLNRHTKRKHLDENDELREDTVSVKDTTDASESNVNPTTATVESLSGKNGMAVCHICGYKAREVQLKSHMARHHSVRKRFRCELCLKEFIFKCELTQHEKSHRDKAGNLVWPPQPPDPSKMERPFPCGLCDARFSKASYLNMHKKKHNREPRPYLCEDCGFSGKTKDQLSKHKARAHGGKTHVCLECGKGYALVWDLRRHQEVVHLGTRQCKCEVCGRQFRDSRYLQTHMKGHRGDLAHECKTCGKKFASLRSMTEHSDTHKPASERKPRVYCHICNKGFFSRGYLQDHLNTHSGARPFACELCGKAFKLRSNLNKHVRFHSEERPFKCPFPHCSKAFKVHAKLTYHMVLHTKESKHVCQTCGKIFTQLCTLKSHMCKLAKPSLADPFVEIHVDSSGAMEIIKASDAEQNCVIVKQEELPSTLKLEHSEFEREVDTEAVASDSVYMCSICEQVFNEWEDIELHVKEHSSEEAPGVEGSVTEEIMLIATEDSVETESNVASVL